MPDPANKQEPHGRRAFYVGAAVIVLGFATALRFSDLGARPMHGDEAVNAFKFDALLQHNEYRYNPYHYHGPTLPYMTLPVAWGGSVQSLEETDEAFYRLLPACAGLAVVLLCFAAARPAGVGAAAFGALLVALSPALVFYSRYYIHEMLLVLFSLAVILLGWAAARAERAGARYGYALACGACVGLMHATKETFIISLACMVGAVGVLACTRREEKLEAPRSWGPWAAAAAAAVVVSVTLFSSFFTHAEGILDSLRTYITYFQRATGEVADPLHPSHLHPFHWYFSLLLYHHPRPGPIFSEGFLIGLALFGGVAAWRGQWMEPRHVAFARFLALYALAMALIYSAIPYKTPWCALGFLQAFALLGGMGAMALLRWAPGRAGKGVIAALMLAGVVHLGWQAQQLNMRFHTDSRNPWFYAHPLRDVRRAGTIAEGIAALHPQGRAMPVHLYAAGMHWPIPFYLRGLSHQLFHPGPPDDRTLPPPGEAPLLMVLPAHLKALGKIRSLVRPHEREAFEGKLEEAYHPEYITLRSGTERVMLIRLDLWEAYVETRRGP